LFQAIFLGFHYYDWKSKSERMEEHARPRDLNGITGAVFAGGRSTRMRTDKAFLEIDGESLLSRQLRCLREAGTGELLISGRPGVDYSPFSARVIYDRESDAGPLAGLAVILEAAHHRIVLCLAVDMPAMTSAMLAKVVASSTETLGCVPFDDGGLQPLAAAYPKAALPLVRRQLREGKLSMQTFAQEALEQGLVQTLHVSPFEQPCFINWNRPLDWPVLDEEKISRRGS
jgi:molybdopterin-guanine dinucleotide biosynthesis protein A